MPEKKIIVLCGVSGVGKTYARENLSELRDLPCVDVADVYLDDPAITWVEATAGVISRTKKLLRHHNTVVVEGYYLPGTITRDMLSEGLGRYAGIEWRLMVEPISLCRKRIEDSGERVEIRLEILERVWEKSGRMLEDLKQRGYTWEPKL
jgi:predicted kinase